MSDTISAGFLIDKLKEMHPPDRGWLFFQELRIGTGWTQYGDQSLDAWAIHAWPSYRSHKIVAPNVRRAFEIKVSETDILRELRNPDKRWIAYSVSHEFYFVAPKGLINKKLLTKEDGLIEWTGETLHMTKAPRVRESMPPRWSFVAALARRVQRME